MHHQRSFSVNAMVVLVVDICNTAMMSFTVREALLRARSRVKRNLISNSHNPSTAFYHLQPQHSTEGGIQVMLMRESLR